MKIKQLIEHLSKLDPELYIFVPGYEGGVDYVSIEGGVKEFALDVNEVWYYGKHALVVNEDKEKFINHQIVKGIIL